MFLLSIYQWEEAYAAGKKHEQKYRVAKMSYTTVKRVIKTNPRMECKYLYHCVSNIKLENTIADIVLFNQKEFPSSKGYVIGEMIIFGTTQS